MKTLRPTAASGGSARTGCAFPRTRSVAAIAVAACAGGCSRSPSQNVLGSFFPSWLLCLGLGVLAAVMCRAAFGLVGFRDDVPAPLLTYLALALAVTCLLWLLWFGH